MEWIQHASPGLRVRGEVGLASLGSYTDPMTKGGKTLGPTLHPACTHEGAEVSLNQFTAQLPVGGKVAAGGDEQHPCRPSLHGCRDSRFWPAVPGVLGVHAEPRPSSWVVSVVWSACCSRRSKPLLLPDLPLPQPPPPSRRLPAALCTRPLHPQHEHRLP